MTCLALIDSDRRAKFARAFAFLGDFLKDPSVIKIGSDISADNAKLADLLHLPQKCLYVFDTSPMIVRLRDGVQYIFDTIDPSSKLYSPPGYDQDDGWSDRAGHPRTAALWHVLQMLQF